MRRRVLAADAALASWLNGWASMEKSIVAQGGGSLDAALVASAALAAVRHR
jgi:hypothetical protein